MFGRDSQCARYLEKTRWPDGFVCRFCGVRERPYRFRHRPHILRCRTCQRDTSLTAGTVMQGTRQRLSKWFLAAYLMTTQTTGMSARQLHRQIGIKRYETVFVMLHKLRAAMVRPSRDRIGGEGIRVQADETLVGGRTRGEGRGRHHKLPVIGAVEVLPLEKPTKHRKTRAGRLRLRLIKGATAEEVETFLADAIAPGSTLVTDGAHVYKAAKRFGLRHDPKAVKGEHEVATTHLRMIHIVFSNLKTWLQGTHHGVSPRHLPAYLNEFVFRFNRRFYPFSTFNAVLGIGMVVKSPEYRKLYSGAWRHPNPAPDEEDDLGCE